MNSATLPSIILFASGRGSNAASVMRYFSENEKARVALVVCNNPQAGVLQVAAEFNVPVLLIEKGALQQEATIAKLEAEQASLIVLAGFLQKIPGVLVAKFPDKIINLHPALLPKFGGKGMYGSRVHEAVLQSGAAESGISIHFVNEHYDEGNLILQARCPVCAGDTPEALAAKVASLEHYFLPRTIEYLLTKQ